MGLPPDVVVLVTGRNLADGSKYGKNAAPAAYEYR